MHNPWPHRHHDGSIHYTHCCAEQVETLPACEEPARGRLRAWVGAAGAALGLATLAFWALMLSAPPVSRAALDPAADGCLTAGRLVRAWVEAEAGRRARVGAGPNQAAFNEVLLWTRAAEASCAAGRTRQAVREFQSLERLIAARTAPREDAPRGDDPER
ncbi:hypothetical protein [Methylobacterium oryzisoli]|uniref:hypothetical protein n=1 Tax=Methylobacterium oryzisoli TaxID=3385502 RepID=UPI00397D46F4